MMDNEQPKRLIEKGYSYLKIQSVAEFHNVQMFAWTSYPYSNLYALKHLIFDKPNSQQYGVNHLQ